MQANRISKATPHDLQRFLKISICMRQAEKAGFKLGRRKVYPLAQAAMKIISKRDEIRFHRIRIGPDRRFSEKEAEH